MKNNKKLIEGIKMNYKEQFDFIRKELKREINQIKNELKSAEIEVNKLATEETNLDYVTFLTIKLKDIKEIKSKIKIINKKKTKAQKEALKRIISLSYKNLGDNLAADDWIAAETLNNILMMQIKEIKKES